MELIFTIPSLYIHQSYHKPMGTYEYLRGKTCQEKPRKVHISRKWKSSAFRKCMVSYTSLKQHFGYISVCPMISTNIGMSLGTFFL